MGPHYQQAIWTKGKSVFVDEQDWTRLELTSPTLDTLAIVRAFIEDDDLQEITVCSANLGMVRTFQKRYAAGHSDATQRKGG